MQKGRIARRKKVEKMKKTRVAFLVCALMALILCAAPAHALATEAPGLASAEEQIAFVEEGLELEVGDAEDDARTGDGRLDICTLAGTRERSAGFGKAVGGVDVKPSAGLVSIQRIGPGSLVSLDLGDGAEFDAVLEQRYPATEADRLVPARLPRFDVSRANSVAISIEDDNDSLKSLLGNNYADNIAGGTRLLYVYPIDGAGYEALARAS